MSLSKHVKFYVVTFQSGQLFFDRVHVFVLMVQKYRYLSFSKQSNKPRRKKCLQYAMWTLAAFVSSQFQLIRMDLYTEVR